MRILVTGAAGMLGSALVPYLHQCGHDVYPTDIAELDVRRPSDVVMGIAATQPDIICHLAAETSLEVCEDEPDHAWLTNAIGTQNVALECWSHGLPMAYISSAGIFDGESIKPYTEFDTPNPINVYGASKLQGEKYVRQLVPNHIICRCGWMMGGGPHKDHKFISHIMDQVEAKVPTIYAVVDKHGSPTYAPDFSRLFETMISSDMCGTFHTVSTGSCSRYDVAREILGLLGSDIRLEPASSLFFQTSFPAPRPPSESMRNYVLDLTGKNTMRPWRDALAEYLQDWA